MLRTSVVIFGLACCIAAPLSAQQPLTAEEACQQTSNIVATAVSMRAKGSSAKRVTRVLTKGRLKVGERYTQTVAPLVNWVFTIDEAIIGAAGAPQNIGGQFHTQCLSLARPETQ
ncbi:MAG: hypothetical protein AAGA28_14675 [Pseudomonadota bacterium]